MPGSRRPSQPAPSFLDTPFGIVTASGIHFHTTQALLEEYAGPVLERVPLETLVARTEVWLRSGQAAALWTLALFLLMLPPVGAAACALTVYVGWETLSPAFVSRRLVAFFRVLDHPGVQALLYVVALSALGMAGQLAAVGVGLGGFIGMRWRLIPMLMRPLIRLLRRPLFTLPVPDQVLRAFVLRAALRHGISIPQLDRLRENFRS